ncbi:MAG: hypothetical protein LBU70_05285 [Chitinispirillales bacterium]|jgi:hypothetical protein|nr:hypothetical protein [Chitinispirillales bacterium]
MKLQVNRYYAMRPNESCIEWLDIIRVDKIEGAFVGYSMRCAGPGFEVWVPRCGSVANVQACVVGEVGWAAEDGGGQ